MGARTTNGSRRCQRVPLAGQLPPGGNRAARAAAHPRRCAPPSCVELQLSTRGEGAGSADELAEAAGRGPDSAPFAWFGRPGRPRRRAGVACFGRAPAGRA
eukprot:10139779-Alexandrium_andersonii.AAC.1